MCTYVVVKIWSSNTNFYNKKVEIVLGGCISFGQWYLSDVIN